jgi:predicted TIM-barrel fold metal-dependent hydrolase
MYRTGGPEAFRPVGEVEFANGVAAMAASGGYGKTAICAGIVSHVNLLLGDGAKPVLEAEITAGNGRFRGIRHSSAWDADPNVAHMYATRPKGLLLDPAFRKGFACLAPLGLSFDAWLFHPQIGELTDLARAFPDTKIVLDHCGGPIGIGRYAGKREEVFPVWKASIQQIAKCRNVVVKLGGLAMCLLGYDFHLRPKPPSSEQAAAAWRPYIETCIEAFGPDRCMFESNFPPDKGQCSYQVIFNAFKRIAAQYSEAEKTALFSKTATDFYRLKLG